MIVTTQGRWTYTASGPSGSFAVNAPVFDAAGLALYAVNTGTGEIYNPAFAVVLAADRMSATVNVAAGLTTGHKVVVYRVEVLSQVQPLSASGPFAGPTAERMIDRLAADVQALKNRVDRALHFPMADNTPAGEIAIASQRSGKVVGFDADGQVTLLSNVPVSPQVALGTFWQTALLASTEAAARIALKVEKTISVRRFGAVGNGVTNDSDAFNAAAAEAQSIGGTVLIPTGTYALKNFRVFSKTTVVCEGGVRLVPFDTADLTSSNSVVQIDGDDIAWYGGEIVSPIHGGYGSPTAPYYNMQVFQSTGGTRPTGITIRDLKITGGRQGIFIFGATNIALDRISAFDQYEWGIAVSATSSAGGPNTTQLALTNIVVERSGLFEGIKIAALYTATGGPWSPHSDIMVHDVMIKDCGRLDPSASNWQEGLDFFTSSSDRINVSKFHIIGCGNGGIEIKRNDTPTVTPNLLRNILVTNGYISVDHKLDGTVGVALNWTANNSATPDTARQILISNVEFEYIGPSGPTGAVCVAVNAYTDVTVSNCQAFGDWTSFVNPSPAGTSSDDTVRRLLIQGCKVHFAQSGVVFGSGVISEVSLVGNVMRTTNDTIAFNSSVTGDGLLIDGGLYEVIAGNARFPFNMPANVTGILVRGATLKGDTFLFVVTDGAGRIEACDLIASGSGVSAVAVSGGTWHLIDNRPQITINSFLYTTSGGTVLSHGNIRGAASSAPSTWAATIGEIVRHSAPAAGGNFGWIATSSGDPATWKAFGEIAA